LLHKKSIHDLRQIAQSFGIPDLTSKTSAQLIQEIELKQGAMVAKADPPPPRPEYDARLMTKIPARSSDQTTITEILEMHIARGLHISFPEPERWHMQWGKKEDTGTTRMPLRTVLKCAEEIMK
jgi:hypothetical protein